MNESEQNLPSLRGKCGGAGVLRRSWFPARNRFNKSDLKGLNRTSWHLWECAPAERWTEIICFQLTSTLRAWPPGHSFRLALSVVQTFAQPKGWMHIPTHLRGHLQVLQEQLKVLGRTKTQLSQIHKQGRILTYRSALSWNLAEPPSCPFQRIAHSLAS